MSDSSRPYIVGVAGGTGSGKTTVARKLIEGLPEGTAAALQQDAYYRSRVDLSSEQRESINFDHPDALETALLIEHLKELRKGRPIQQPQYDFVDHLRKAETVCVPAHPVIVVEGILLLFDRELREQLDLKIFVETAADIRILRRLRRDMEVRGRTFDQVCDQYYATVRPMHLQFVEPSKRFADVIVPEGGNNRIALDMVLTKMRSMIESESS